MRGYLVLAAIVVASGCGLDVEGTEGSEAPPAPSVDGGSPTPPLLDGGARVDGSKPGNDAGTPPPSDASPPPLDAFVQDSAPPAPCTTPPGACTQSIPAGWKLAAFEASRATACPGGFPKHDVVADPAAGSGACTCTCAVAGTPTCTKGDVTTKWSNDASCNMTGATLTVNGPGCAPLPGGSNLASHVSAHPAPATISCAASTATDKNQVTSTDERLCDAPMACEEDVCNGMPPAGFSACIYAAGDVTCPAGPWNGSRVVVGDSVTLACSACNNCTASADCTGAQLAFFSDGMCKNGKATVPADDTCNATSGGGIGSFQYSATVSNQQCTATDTSTASVDLQNAKTVCCR